MAPTNNNKSLEAKKKIIAQIRSKEIKEALKHFFKTFNQEKPADIEFIKNFYVELTKQELYKETYETFEKIKPWYTDDLEFQDIFENIKKIYADNLILEGNTLAYQRIEKEKSLAESLKRSDSLTREKMQKENKIQLDLISEKAKKSYLKALEMYPDNLHALEGLKKCYEIDGNEQEIAVVNKKIEELSPSFKAKVTAEKEREEEVTNFEYKEVPVDHDILGELKELYEQKKYEEFIEKTDKAAETLLIPVPILLLKVKAYMELRQFKNADATIFECEGRNSHFAFVKESKAELQELKHSLYIKAAASYLKKGVELGRCLGMQNFLKAKKCILKALEINPDNLNLLDQAYTVYKYLGEEDEAFKIKASIYSLKPEFEISYENQEHKTLCFIATYAFYDKPSIVDEFRWFRREYLLNNSFGLSLNSLYVRISSKLTMALRNNNFVRLIAKLVLYIPLLFVRLLGKLKSK